MMKKVKQAKRGTYDNIYEKQNLEQYIYIYILSLLLKN